MSYWWSNYVLCEKLWIFCAIDNIVCDVHQINGGEEEATVVGNTATVMFEGTGPSADNVVTDFDLRIRRERETEPGIFDDIVVGPTCSTAATETPPPFTMTCSVDDGRAIAITTRSML